mgnify:FL=1
MFTGFELGLINVALKTKLNAQGQMEARNLDLDQMEDGISVNRKLKACVENDKFKDSEAEFTTTEKALILKLLERPWSVEDAENYISLKKKLA